ncbi:MAG: 50S ribosomal protein L11 methyltransferase [Ferruginibacter sp.]
MQYTEVLFIDCPQEQKDLLIALLSENGFNGFEEEEENLKAYIDRTAFDEDVFLYETLKEVEDVRCLISVIDEINWNAKWEADFEPVAVSHPMTGEPFAFIRANFHQPDPAYQYDIIVTPKMSFGTGHHATTYLMVSQMATLDLTGKKVIDFGTGTGILSILAEKMGAEKVTAIDCDDWSIDNAKENFSVNGCMRTEIIKGEAIPENTKATIILANINLNILVDNMEAINAAASPGAAILFSGVMLHDEEHIVHKIKGTGMIITAIHKRENWLAIEATVVNKI